MPEPPTYADLVEAFGSSVSEDLFAECLPHALAAVRELTFPNEPAAWNEPMWRRAVCAAVLADASSGGGHGMDDAGGASLTLGKFSSSGGSPGSGSGSATQDAMRSAAARELVGSGLLFMGL